MSLVSNRSVSLCILAMLLFACSDALAKSLTQTFDPLQIAWFRYVAATILFIAVFAVRGRPPGATSPGAQLARGLGMLGATVLLIAALRFQPMAEATALVFLSPAIVTLLSLLILRERVTSAQWMAVAGGLAGVLVILKPGFADFRWFSVLPILSACCWAVGLVYTRKSLASDSLFTTLGFSALTGMVLLSLTLPAIFHLPSRDEAVTAGAMAILWLAAHACIAFAYRQPDARVSQLAPFSYTHMIWAVALGYLVFGSLPDISTALGCTMIAASGLWAATRKPT